VASTVNSGCLREDLQRGGGRRAEKNKNNTAQIKKKRLCWAWVFRGGIGEWILKEGRASRKAD